MRRMDRLGLVYRNFRQILLARGRPARDACEESGEMRVLGFAFRTLPVLP
jgi:hypothetical protein